VRKRTKDDRRTKDGRKGERRGLKLSDEYTLIGGVLYKFVDGRDLLMVSDLMQNEIIQAVHYKRHLSSKRTEDAI